MKQLFWCSLQIAVAGTVIYWTQTDPSLMDGAGQNPFAVVVFAVLMAMAATSAAMIARDSFLFVVRLVRRALGKPNDPNNGRDLIGAGTGLRQPHELTASSGVRKQIR